MKRVLVVEDNRLERKMVQHILENEFGQEVAIDVTTEGLSALKNMSETNYNLVVTDLIMPEFEGIELIRKIKEIYPNCKIIAISGSSPYYLYLAKKLGIQGVFTKPLDKNRFLKNTREILELSESGNHGPN